MSHHRKRNKKQLPAAVPRPSLRPSNRPEFEGTTTPSLRPSDRSESGGENTPSARPSDRPEFDAAEGREDSELFPAKGSDSIPQQGIPAHTAAAPPVKSQTSKLTRKQLAEIEAALTARDHAVLQSIRKYRFLTSDQIGRLYFPDCSTKTSRTRNQNLLLKRLADYGLICSLGRKVGGYGGGSSAQIWHLTSAGQHLLVLNDPDTQRRKRFVEPSPMFLEHTLAIAECMVQLTCICRDSFDLNLEAVDTEPSCWRRFLDGMTVCYLKPDLAAIISYDGYEDRYFVEMDLSTEAPSTVVDKCKMYLRYYHTGIEQKETKMFPLVVWIVKDAARKERLRAAIRESIVNRPKMFLVITPDELENMLRQNIDPKELC